MIHNLYKQRGETPLECVQRFMAANPELKGQKITYLGRLDPMAEGVLIAATGQDVGQETREKFLGLDKKYDFVSLFGFATDTYDILGKIMRVEKLYELNENYVRQVAMIYQGERDQVYPAFSSKMIASRESLHDFEESVEMPSKKINIYKMQFHKLDTLNSKELFGRLLMDISRVNGNFRQNQILNLWKEMLTRSEATHFIGKFSAHVSSGTYIRGIVNELGQTLGCGATALSIRRTRVGDFTIEDSLK